jgi:aminocarboxymuconate-semialdehyde decarboxylase
MRTIDMHAHLMPPQFWQTVDQGQPWYGVRYEQAADRGWTVSPAGRNPVLTPKLRFTPEERLRDMDEQKVDVQVISVATPLFGYYLDAAQGRQLAREVNEEIAAMTRQWPTRFVGLATLPMQEVGTAIDELERAVHRLGLKGVELDTVVNGLNWDEPAFLPFFKAAEAMGAVLFFHPQPHANLVLSRAEKYGLTNSIGVPLEDALVIATLIFGGILDACPDLKICIAHGGGPACFGMGRLDRGWQVRSEARTHIRRPPSTYQRRLYYDCLTNSETALRFLLDHVGADRVVLGSDWPYVRWDPSPVTWVQGLQSLSEAEKDAILWKNLERLLGM